jgi:pyruvate dehydrogenase E2 component (dihydrolipoamide acetyltransferase)
LDGGYAASSSLRFARENDIELASITGTGKFGQIIRKDVLAILDNQPESMIAQATTPPSDASSQFEPFSMIRKTISERLSRSWREIPHVFIRIEIDATRLLVVRKALIEELETKIPIEAILVKACLPALKEFPTFNATVVEGGIELHQHYNIGLAADTETGLIVPVSKDADRLSLRDMVAIMLDLLPRAVEKPVAIDGAVEIRPMLEVTLSFDHRAIDGGLAQRFLNRIQENLEEPVKALL